MKHKYLQILFYFIFPIAVLGQIKINTIQLKEVKWFQPVLLDANNIYITNVNQITVECKAICLVTLQKEDFSVWVDNKLIKGESECLNNQFKAVIEISKDENHEIYIAVTKGQTTVKTSILNISRPPKKKRIALLIGNSKYQYGTSLGNNPINDANDMGERLKSLGFEATVIINANLQTIKESIKLFQIKVKDAEIATFFYAGHGVEIDGKKYIIPVDAELKSPIDARDDAYNIETLFDRLQSGGAIHNLIILDACRDDPFRAQELSYSNTSRGWSNVSRGFTPIELEKTDNGNTYLAMATSWGKKAQNGDGRNGVYTANLLKNLRAGERLEKVFDKTGINVKEETQQKQNPQFIKEISLDREFTF
ncbi:caspase family protein [Arcicella rigui]|uniref:Caspase family protein n=1 Tax=Arcicella rigui TaxID=797020 RepID=A0ABU5Q7Z7_9BACT|nr:caspase family protein [Arcicella rigui]MEA5138975.1 caspase family protein [Arcicella rigui]